MKKYLVSYSSFVVEYEIEADSKEMALIIADNYFNEYIPEVKVEEIEEKGED